MPSVAWTLVIISVASTGRSKIRYDTPFEPGIGEFEAAAASGLSVRMHATRVNPIIAATVPICRLIGSSLFGIRRRPLGGLQPALVVASATGRCAPASSWMRPPRRLIAGGEVTEV